MQSKKTKASDAPIVYETTNPLYFSFYSDGAFEKKWLAWKALHFELREDATLTYMKHKRSSSSSSNKNSGNVLDLSVVSLEKIPVDGGMGAGAESGASMSIGASQGGGAANVAALGVITDVGVRVTCKKDGLPSEFRCVFPQSELMLFLDALYNVRGCKVTNLREFKRAMEWDKANVPDWIPVSSYASAVTNPLAGTFIDPQDMSVQMSMSRLHHSDSLHCGDSEHDYHSLDGAAADGEAEADAEGGVSMQQRSAGAASARDRSMGASALGRRGASSSSPGRGASSSSGSTTDGAGGNVLVAAAAMLGALGGKGGSMAAGAGSKHGAASTHRAAGVSQSHRVGQTSARNVGDGAPSTSRGAGGGRGGGGRQYIIQQSAMRRAITKAMDQYDYNNRKAQTVARRGVFKWLPVAFTNDLVHGSWWFVGGALFTTIIAIIILMNSYYPSEWLGHDNSYNGMPRDLYRVTWVMLSVSGVLYLLGSLAFVRAVNEPPMQPLFPCSVHTATDELLGSWLFLFGTVPSIPYAVCYLYWYNNAWYLGMLAVAIIGTLGGYLFVLSCYPSEKARSAQLLQCLVFVCGRKPCIMKHCANDWLAGTWMMFYATAVGSVALVVLTVMEIMTVEETGGVEGTDRVESSNRITMFIDATTLLAQVVFLVGSMYFVAGSYPVDPNIAASAAGTTSATAGDSRKVRATTGGSLDAVGEDGDDNVSDQSQLMETFNARNLVANGGIV